MKKFVRVVILLFAVILIFAYFCLPVYAEDDGMEEYKNFVDNIPKDIRDKLPFSVYSENGEEIADGVREMSGVKFLLEELFGALLSGIKEAVPYICRVIGLLIIASLSEGTRNRSSGTCTKSSTFTHFKMQRHRGFPCHLHRKFRK